MRAGIYTRISSDRDDTRLGVERQEQDCRRLCKDRGWTVAEVYVDNDISAADAPGRKRKARPEYDRLRRDIDDGRLDAVAVWDLDRLTRRPDELEAFVTLCEQRGVTLEWLSGSVKPSGDGLLVARIKAAVAAEEVRKQRERSRRRSDQDAERGAPRPGGRRAFGWESDGVTIRESEAAMIREAAERVLRGETLRSICFDWRRRGSATAYGTSWSLNGIKALLRNPRNNGKRQHRGEVIGDADWPAIFDDETFAQLEAVFADKSARQVRTPPRDYPLRGVLSCGECGHQLVSAARKKPVAGDSERRVRYYTCRSDTGGCDRVIVSAERVEEHVLKMVLGLVDDPAIRALTADERASEADEIKELVRGNAEDGRKLAGLEDKYADGDLSQATYRRKRQEFRGRVETRNTRLSVLRGSSALDRFDGRLAEHWDELTADEQRTIILSLVRSVDVKSRVGPPGTFDPRRLEFRWNYAGMSRMADRWAEDHGGWDAVMASPMPQ